MVKEISTIQLDKSIISDLKKLKRSPRETYVELIRYLITLAKRDDLKNQYDEFLHKTQQKKMKELWDNKEDKKWENV